MTKSSGDGFSARLRRLPGQFLLALVNATAILAIVAAVLVIVAIGKVQRVAANVSATLTDAVLSRVDIDPAQFLSRLEGIEAEIGALTAALEELEAKDNSIIDPKIADLKAKLGDVEAGIDRLVDGRAALVDQAMSELGTAIGDAVRSLRHCPCRAEWTERRRPGTASSGQPTKESGYPRVSYLPAGMTER